jgi:hypothetical protein
MTNLEDTAKELAKIIRANKTQLQKIIDKSFGRNLSDSEYFSILYAAGSAQKYADYIENRHITQVNGSKVPASLDRGDYKIGDTYWEFKFSTKSNFLQIRDWQEVNYRLIDINMAVTPAVICYYELTKEQMAKELIGASATHKVKSAIQGGEKIEKSLRLTETKKKFWDKTYKVATFIAEKTK